MYPGDLYGVRNKLAGSASDRIDTQDYTFDDPNVWRAWRTATSCFKALKEPEVLQLTKVRKLYRSVGNFECLILEICAEYLNPSRDTLVKWLLMLY